jgi:anti-sigma regulatory factor (Ser/Thr protein kinase)
MAPLPDHRSGAAACPKEQAAGGVNTGRMAPTTPGHGHAPVARRRRAARTGDETKATATGWQFRSYLDLGAFPAAASCARLHTKLVVREWGMAAVAEVAELVVSELVANAVAASNELAAPAGEQAALAVPVVRFWLAADQSNVLIRVWDANPALPVRQDGDLEAETGRGLLLVESLSAQWGSLVPDGRRGKVVWAVVTAP